MATKVRCARCNGSGKCDECQGKGKKYLGFFHERPHVPTAMAQVDVGIVKVLDIFGYDIKIKYWRFLYEI